MSNPFAPLTCSSTCSPALIGKSQKTSSHGQRIYKKHYTTHQHSNALSKSQKRTFQSFALWVGCNRVKNFFKNNIWWWSSTGHIGNVKFFSNRSSDPPVKESFEIAYRTLNSTFYLWQYCCWHSVVEKSSKFFVLVCHSLVPKSPLLAILLTAGSRHLLAHFAHF